MTRFTLLAPALLLALSPAAEAQNVRRELRALGPEARLQWPALAELVAQAERVARDGTGDEQVVRRRYGRDGASRAEARRDRRALEEALAAVTVLERAARSRGQRVDMIRGIHHQLLAVINRGFGEQGRASDVPAARIPKLEPAWQTGLSYAQALDRLRPRRVVRYGLCRAAVLLLLALAEDARDGAATRGPLDATRFPLTLAWAGEAALYDVLADGSPKPTGWALLQHHAGELTLTVHRAGWPTVRAVLERGERWRAEAKVPRPEGLTGRLDGATSKTLRQQAEYRLARPGRIEGRWRLLDGEREVARGREVLALRSLDGAPPARAEPLLTQSALFAQIAAACREVVGAGTVPAELLVTTSNRVGSQVLLEGPAIFGATAARIAAAEREVLYQALTIEVESQAGQAILGALRALAARPPKPGAPPVRVRFVINAHWAVDFGSGALQRAVAALRLDPRRVDVKVVGHSHKLLGGLHAKTLVVDGRRAIVTGANPEFVHDAGKPWFDAAFEVEGRAAEGLRQDFNHLWHKVTKTWLPALEPDSAEPAGRTPVLIATRKADGWLFANSIDNPQGQAFVTAITRARKRVRLHTPNLNDDAIRRAVVEAAGKNGVTVQLVFPRGFNAGGSKLMGGTNATTVKRLYAKLERRYGAEAAARLQIKWYAAADGSGQTEGNEAGASHTKYASFDGQVAIVGSGNLDTQAINHSREVNLVVDGAELVQAWDRQHFEPSWRRGVPARATTVDLRLGQAPR